MTAIADLLTPEQRAEIETKGFVVRKASTDPNPPRRPLTMADAIVVDPESEALIHVQCVDCCEPMLLDPKPPIDERTGEPVPADTPRIPLCGYCHPIRAKEHAATGTLVSVARRPEKETKVPDLTMTDAELGANVRQAVKETIAEALPAKREKAKQKQSKADRKAKALLKEAQAARRGVLPSVTIGKAEVPALDLGDITDMGLMPSTKERKPYNKALFALGEPILDKDTATYATLVEAHRHLLDRETCDMPAAPEPERTVALLDPSMKAKVKALRKVRPDLSKKRAEQIVASL